MSDGISADEARIPCPDCGGRGKIVGTVEGVPASVCTTYTTCERCWPRNPDGTTKFWNDGTAGTIPAAADLAATVDRLEADNQRLQALLTAVMPSHMGATPDLGWPVGYDDDDDPWQAWEDDVRAALSDEGDTSG